MSDLLDRLNAEENSLIDTYIQLFSRVSTSILKKIKEKDPAMFASMMASMATIYQQEEFQKQLDSEQSP